MSKMWKILLALGLVLPVAAFVAGSLAASSADEPARRAPIILESPSTTASPDQSPSGRPSGRPSRPPGDGRDDEGDDRGKGDIPVIVPTPGSVDDERDERDDDDDDDRDDRDDDDDDDDRGGDDDD